MTTLIRSGIQMTRRTAARAAMALGFGTALACTGACGSTLAPEDIRMQFALSDASQLQALSTVGGKQMVTVTGGISLPSDCAGHGLFTIVGQTIDATVESLPLTGSGPCAGPSAPNTYTLTFANVPAGRWTVRVYHKQAGGAPTLEHQAVAVVVRY